MSLKHATEGLFVLYEQPSDSVEAISRRRVLLWDVKPRELQVARGHIEFDIERRIAAKLVVRVRLDSAAEESRVSVELSTKEVVDLIGPCRLADARRTADLVADVTGAKLVD